MIEKFFLKERTDDFYLISLFLSSVVLIGISYFTGGFLSYIVGLGGFGYGIGFLYLLMKDARGKNKVVEYTSLGLLLIFISLFIYLLFEQVTPDVLSLIIGIIIVAIPLFVVNKKFFPLAIPITFTFPQFSNLSGNYLIQIIESHPVISLTVLIVGIYIIFKMMKSIIKIIILTVIVWAILRFLLGIL